MAIVLDFEKPIIELERKISELQEFTQKEHIDISDEIEKLTDRLEKLKKDIFGNLTSWQRVQLARHPNRPYTLDYVELLCEEFIPICGDRHYAEDKAIVAGFAVMDGMHFAIVGHQKGRDMEQNLERNFGCPHPEGYRKAIRVMRLAEKFGLPVVTFIDTPGAYPGVDAEERGQAEAIAYNLREMAGLKIPIISVVIGEGGSGGALGIGVSDRIFVMENAYYSVISPEGCAAILWRDRAKSELAADALKLTGPDLIRLKIVDGVVPEPPCGAHRDWGKAAGQLKKSVLSALQELSSKTKEELVEERYTKYRNIGVWKEGLL